MSKWYKNSGVNIVLSCRVRLARNIKKYSYSNKITNEAASDMINSVRSAFLENNDIDGSFKYIPVNGLDSMKKRSLMESHIISPVLLQKDQDCGVIVNNDESVNIMLNEEDHIRIQTIFPGEDIDRAWEAANKIDDIIEKTIEYDFHKDYGYLTACPTNVGTGLRASFMMHLPVIEMMGQVNNVINAVSKLGITVRGIYGEGTEPMGAIYQVSNQFTLGQSEEEIISNLKNVTKLVKDQEEALSQRIFTERSVSLLDTIYRSYGILTNARKITSKEAMGLLSGVRLGLRMDVVDFKAPKLDIYEIMMKIQPGNIQNILGGEVSAAEADEFRAKYIRENFV